MLSPTLPRQGGGRERGIVEQVSRCADIFRVFIVHGRIEGTSIQRADRQGLTVFNCVQEHVISQYVPLDGLDECLPAAFKTFEEIGSTESHEPFAGAGQIMQQPGIVRYRWIMR